MFYSFFLFKQNLNVYRQRGTWVVNTYNNFTQFFGSAKILEYFRQKILNSCYLFFSYKLMQ